MCWNLFRVIIERCAYPLLSSFLRGIKHSESTSIALLKATDNCFIRESWRERVRMHLDAIHILKNSIVITFRRCQFSDASFDFEVSDFFSFRFGVFKMRPDRFRSANRCLTFLVVQRSLRKIHSFEFCPLCDWSNYNYQFVWNPNGPANCESLWHITKKCSSDLSLAQKC